MAENSNLINGVAAALPVVGGVIDGIFQNSANKKNRQFAEQMYERQKNDNLAQWNLQNDYNNPQAQMKRLQEAGLNPNLVYGSGGQTGGTASPIPTADKPNFSYEPLVQHTGQAGAQAFSSYFDTQIKQAQLDNLKAQNTDITNSAILKAAQTMSTLAGGEKTQFSTQFLKDTAHITRAYMAEQANKMHWDQFSSQQSAITAEDRNQFTLEKLKQEVSNMKDTGKGIKLSNALKQIETELRSNGLSPNDPAYMRLINRVLTSKGISIDSIFK